MRFVVYDPKGEMFEVIASKLKDLIVNRGWTFWHPSKVVEVFGTTNRDSEKEDGTT